MKSESLFSKWFSKSKIKITYRASKIVTKYVPCFFSLHSHSYWFVFSIKQFLEGTVTEPMSSRSSNEPSTAEQSFNCCGRRQRRVVSHENCLDNQIGHTLILIFYYVKSAKITWKLIWNKIKTTCHNMILNQNHNLKKKISNHDFKSFDFKAYKTLMSAYLVIC